MKVLSNKDTAISSFVKELEERIKHYSVPIIKEGYRDFNLCKSNRPLIYFSNESIEARYPSIVNKIKRREGNLYPIVVIGIDSSSKLADKQTRFSSTSVLVLEGLNNSPNLVLKGKSIKLISNMQIAIFGRSRLIVNNISDAIIMALFDKYIYLSDMIVYQNNKPIARVSNQVPFEILNYDNLEFSDTTEQEKGVVITACDLEFSIASLLLHKSNTSNITTSSVITTPCE